MTATEATEVFRFGLEEVRVLTDADGNPKFVATDVAKAITLTEETQP